MNNNGELAVWCAVTKMVAITSYKNSQRKVLQLKLIDIVKSNLYL